MTGLFITFEGGEGSGKSTQIARLARVLELGGLPVRTLREPGGTSVGEAVRRILLDPESGGIDPRTELLLYEAARAQLVAEIVEPALEAGEVVLCDRFLDSTTAYQGYARGLPLEMVADMNQAATGGRMPDRTLILDIEPELGIARATANGADRLEREDMGFHQLVRDGFLTIATVDPRRVRVVDARGPVEAVFERVVEQLADLSPLASALEGRA